MAAWDCFASTRLGRAQPNRSLFLSVGGCDIFGRVGSNIARVSAPLVLSCHDGTEFGFDCPHHQGQSNNCSYPDVLATESSHQKIAGNPCESPNPSKSSDWAAPGIRRGSRPLRQKRLWEGLWAGSAKCRVASDCKVDLDDSKYTVYELYMI